MTNRELSSRLNNFLIIYSRAMRIILYKNALVNYALIAF